MFCCKCGKQNPDGAAFCNGCGAKMIAPAKTETPAAQGTEPAKAETPAAQGTEPAKTETPAAQGTEPAKAE
ncbi:MAG: zinc-ribbon domain-containing protein, partial [Lachnospiraceae bacterium]